MDGRQEKRHSSEVTAARERRSKRTILKRTVILMLLCGVGLFIPLFLRLWDIAIVHHEDYQRQATGQQTLDLSVSAALVKSKYHQGSLQMDLTIQRFRETAGQTHLRPQHTFNSRFTAGQGNILF